MLEGAGDVLREHYKRMKHDIFIR